MKHVLNSFIFFLVVIMTGCSGDSDTIEIAHKNSSVSGEQAGLVGIVTDKPASLSIEEKNGQWTVRVRVQLTNKKRVAFGDYHGSTFELRLLDKDNEQADFAFTPGATDSGREKTDSKLMDLMIASVGTAKEFVFHYTTDDRNERDKIEEIAKEATGVEIINFDFMAQLFELDENDTATESNASEEINNLSENTQEIEAYVLHFHVDDSYHDGYSNHPYKDNYKVTIHMNGDADIHTEIHYPYGGDIGDPKIEDYKGSWAQRSIKRGANFVDYYDIEFNNGERNLNWCVEEDRKSIYFTWSGFEKRDPKSEAKITKVDILYVK